MANVLFKYGTPEAYAGLLEYDPNSLYFIQEEGAATGVLYKGSTRYSPEQQLEFVSSTPGTLEEGKLYVVSDGTSVSLVVRGEDGSAETVGGGTVQPGAITNLNVFNDSLLVTSSELTSGELPDNDTTIPTSGAVKGAIETAIQEVTDTITALGDPVTGASAERNETNNGTVITLTRASGTNPITVNVSDLFLTSAEYDSASHTLKLYVQGVTDPVEVDLADLIPQAVTTEDVSLSDTITVTTPVGNFTKGQVVSVTDLQTFLVNMLSQDSNPTTTQPSVSVSLTGAGAKEVGTQFTPSWSVTLNPGAYSANKDGAQPTNVTATSYTVTDTNSGSADTQSGTFTQFTVEDSTNYRVSATVAHTAGAVPTTYLGEPYPDGQIKAGSKSGQSSTVTGYRNCWWGYKGASNLITPATGITAAQVKQLGNVNRNRPSSLAATDMQQIFVAIPANSGVNTLAIVDSGTGLPVTVSGRLTVQIGGVGDHSPIDYYVFYSDNATPAPGSTTYSFTWTNV